jgi:hypothetical protein
VVSSFSAIVATLSQLSDESRLAQSDFPASFLQSSAFTHQDTDWRIDEVEVAIGSDGCGARVAAQHGLDQFRR